MKTNFIIAIVVVALVATGGLGTVGSSAIGGKSGYPESSGTEGAAPTRGPDADGVASSPWDDRDRNRIFDELDAMMEGAEASAPFPVIVLFNDAPTDASVSALKAEIGDFTLKSNKDDPSDAEGRPWEVIPAWSADLTRDQILQLSRRPEVRHIEHDGEVRLLMNTARVETGVNQAVTSFGVDGDRTGAQRTYTKDDIVICVADTGIVNNHVDLDQGQIIAWKDYVGTSTTPVDDHGHGTHVAATAAGQGDGNSAYKGVAPGAALVGVKVLNAAGSGTETQIVNGVNFCSNNRVTYGIEILTMSIGGGTCTSGNDAMSAAVNSAWNNGLVVTIAAGNSGPGYCTIASPGSAANVITVGAMSDPKNAACPGYLGGGWYLASFSSRGATGDGRIKPEIVAPGVCITSARSGTSSSYTTMSGTSMATPFVAGVAALMLDANPTMTNAQVKSTLMSTSEDWGPDNQAAEPQSYDYGAGRLQAFEAVKSAIGGSGTGPANPTHFHRAEDLAATGRYDEYALAVTSTTWNVALTLIIPSASGSKDFDMRLYSPSGSQIGSALGTTRQETISKAISSYGTGTYKIRVESYSGSGSYWLDVDAGASTLTLSVDQ